MADPTKVSEGSGAARLVWHRAQTCSGSECVEVAVTGGGVTMRNSKDPATTLKFTVTEWLEFVAGIRAGDFDELSEAGE
jgi:Domain of unknown function (DUF397)